MLHLQKKRGKILPVYPGENCAKKNARTKRALSY